MSNNDPEKDGVSADVMQSEQEPQALSPVHSIVDKSEPSLPKFHPAVYVMYVFAAAAVISHPRLTLLFSSWISLSSTVILFNKWILDDAKFGMPKTSHP